jgi:hypothetical protein
LTSRLAKGTVWMVDAARQGLKREGLRPPASTL